MSKRPEKTHYVPPGRRSYKTPGVSVVAASHHSTPATKIAPPPPAPLPPSSLTPLPVAAHTPNYINTRNSPTTPTSYIAPQLQPQHQRPPPTHGRFDPSTAPATSPLPHPRNTNTSDAMRSGHPSPHMRTIVPRRESYEVAMAPVNGHRRVEVRDLRSNDFPIYRNDRIDSSPRLSHATKYDGSHLGRSGRNYDDRYNDIRPPFRGKAPHQAPSPMMTPVRILRNPDRERERARESRDEFVEERGSRQFTARVESRAYSAAAPPSKARYLGDNIHSLTPTTSLSERCERYIDTLHPERPDPPTQDEPYEYPYTQPCEPTTLPEINGRNFPIAADWARPVYARTPSIEHEYFVPFSKIRPEKRSRHRHRRRDEFDGASSVDEDCARRMYRLHT